MSTNATAAQPAPGSLDTLDRDTLERALIAARAFAADLERLLAAKTSPPERHLRLVRPGISS